VYAFFAKAKYALFAYLLLIGVVGSKAQSITGIVTGSDKKPVIAANVLLLKEHGRVQ
jgi:hypothetical protein